MPRSVQTHRARESNSNQRSHFAQVAARWRASARWRALVKLFWAQPQNQACATCGVDLVTVAREGRAIDHVVAHRGDEGRFWDESNWQALCGRCHSLKSNRERWQGR